MQLSISNIAWNKNEDENIYNYLKDNNITGLEIAPTRIYETHPYEHLKQAEEYSKDIFRNFGLNISSMQSIWYGMQENIFKSEESQKKLFDYTSEAIDFANTIKCNNLVFGCPKNRNISKNEDIETFVYIFRKLGDYAQSKNTIIAIEPNPTIYGTNFINTTEEAIEIIKRINNKGIMLNVDFGTIIHNKESLNIVFDNINLVNHIHISEPYLDKIVKREEHIVLANFLKSNNYKKYVSIEMKNLNSIDIVYDTLKYLKDVFS